MNSPGSDSESNKSVNGEYVVVLNTSKSSKTLTGFTIRDQSKHIYTFGKFTLKGKKSVTVYTGKGIDSSSKRYMGRGWHIWNNKGPDSATLKNADGKNQDVCAWHQGKKDKNKTVKSSVTC